MKLSHADSLILAVYFVFVLGIGWLVTCGIRLGYY